MEDSNHEAGLCKFQGIGVTFGSLDLFVSCWFHCSFAKLDVKSDCELNFSLGQRALILKYLIW
jgi:hypothetical protein